MKIIFLNCWQGKISAKLSNFFAIESKTVDIFCLMEVPQDLLIILRKILLDYKYFYNSSFENGQVVFIRNKYSFINQEKILIYPQIDNDTGLLQKISVSVGNIVLHIGSVHGKARPGHKMDTLERLNQSETIIDSFSNEDGPKIIGGDFNLLPYSKSILMFEDNEYIDLIKKFNIKTTRGEINRKNYLNGEVQEFADYCFVSSDIKVKSFEVPDVEISDHLPLILEFDIS